MLAPTRRAQKNLIFKIINAEIFKDGRRVFKTARCAVMAMRDE